MAIAVIFQYKKRLQDAQEWGYSFITTQIIPKWSIFTLSKMAVCGYLIIAHKNLFAAYIIII